MKTINLKEIINIENIHHLNKTFTKDQIDKPLFNNNYLFHYFIALGNLEGLKLKKFPIHLENNDGLNGFHLCAKEYNIDILTHLINTYPEYIYNRNQKEETFVHYLPFSEIPILINKFPKIDWFDLIENTKNNLLPDILLGLKYDDLLLFFKNYKKTQHLIHIINNIYLSDDEKIKILDKYDDEDLNKKYTGGEGLICPVINNSNKKLFDYLLKRNIDFDYIFYNKNSSNNNPLYMAIYIDITSNTFIYSKELLKFNNIKNGLLDNILHYVIFNRISFNNMSKDMIISYDLDEYIFKSSTTEMWNDINIENLTPFDIIVDLSFDIYSKFIPKNIKIDNNKKKILIEDLTNEYNEFKNENINLWLKYFDKLETFNDDNKMIIENYKYAHVTFYSASFVDEAIYALYLMDTYKDLYVPTISSYQINNKLFSDGLTFQSSLVGEYPIFPWFIMCSNTYDDEVYIHPYLNNLINSVRREGKKRFAFVLLIIHLVNTFHANCLIYDFKNMTIERFEPDGSNLEYTFEKLDNILEEELTWDTGLNYMKPSDFLPQNGFQLISNEKKDTNIKRGDLGGFCLAWCLWYTETRIKNPDIHPKILVEKALKNIISTNLKFSEYIRNYSEYINKYRLNIFDMLDINEREYTNQYISNKIYNKIIDFVINKYSLINQEK
jgi:hypothetical protein